eukprot:SAG22_NODE_4282_length_1318_cov_1.123872_1_plen_297_part_01
MVLLLLLPPPLRRPRFSALLAAAALLSHAAAVCDPGSAPAGGGPASSSSAASASSRPCSKCDGRSASPTGEECALCGPGTEPDPANTMCVTCGAGHVGADGACALCAAGKEPSLDHQVCNDCPLGRWTVPGGRCKAYIALKESTADGRAGRALPGGGGAYFWCDGTRLVRWIFDGIDADRDGAIRRAELRLSPFDTSLRASWLRIDADGDHMASWAEWSDHFDGLKAQLGDSWRAYILRTGCNAASGSSQGESSCIPVLHGQPAAAYGACTACMVRQRSSLLKAVSTAFPSVSLPFL